MTMNSLPYRQAHVLRARCWENTTKEKNARANANSTPLVFAFAIVGFVVSVVPFVARFVSIRRAVLRATPRLLVFLASSLAVLRRRAGSHLRRVRGLDPDGCSERCRKLFDVECAALVDVESLLRGTIAAATARAAAEALDGVEV